MGTQREAHSVPPANPSEPTLRNSAKLKRNNGNTQRTSARVELNSPVGRASTQLMSRNKSSARLPAEPLRIFTLIDGQSSVAEYNGAADFDVVSYQRGVEVPPYDCKIDGVSWAVTVPPAKLEAIKQVMTYTGVNHMWVDCLVSSFTNPPLMSYSFSFPSKSTPSVLQRVVITRDTCWTQEFLTHG